MYGSCDFSMFSKGDVMWAKRVIHNKSTVSKMLRNTLRLVISNLVEKFNVEEIEHISIMYT